MAAVGFYLMGVNKLCQVIYLEVANGSDVDASSEVTKGPYQQVAVQFIYHVWDLRDKARHQIHQFRALQW